VDVAFVHSPQVELHCFEFCKLEATKHPPYKYTKHNYIEAPSIHDQDLMTLTGKESDAIELQDILMMLKGGIEFQLASKGVSFSDGEII
jgi:hypothetical protein